MKYLISLIGVIILTVIIIKTHNKPQKENSKNSEKKIPNNEPQPPDYYPYQKSTFSPKKSINFIKSSKNLAENMNILYVPKLDLKTLFK